MDSRRDNIRTAGGRLRRLVPELPRVKLRGHRRFGTSSDAATDKVAGLTTARLVAYSAAFRLIAEEPPSCGEVCYARVSVQLVWALLPLLKASDPDERAALAVELKAVIVRYRSPIWESPAQIGEHSEQSWAYRLLHVRAEPRCHRVKPFPVPERSPAHIVTALIQKLRPSDTAATPRRVPCGEARAMSEGGDDGTDCSDEVPNVVTIVRRLGQTGGPVAPWWPSDRRFTVASRRARLHSKRKTDLCIG